MIHDMRVHTIPDKKLTMLVVFCFFDSKGKPILVPQNSFTAMLGQSFVQDLWVMGKVDNVGLRGGYASAKQKFSSP
jgi:hypothetical protein